MIDRTFMKILLLTLSLGCTAAITTGCVERRVVYVPTQPAVPPANYTYSPPAAPVAPAPPTAPAPPPDAAALQSDSYAPPANGTVVATAPPTPQVEVVPIAPGPDYVWLPGYWSIGVRGGWIWVGGHYVIRPRPHAVWVTGHWARHGRSYIWVGGGWR